MEPENWTHPATHINTIESEEESLHPIQAYTDGSKSELGVGAGVVIFLDNEITKTMQYRLNKRCTNNEAEQMAILKALEYIQLTASVV
jgi:ribonuclease HI